MKAIDTNLLVRWVLRDDPQQSALAADILNTPVFVADSVLLELGWVLHKVARLSRRATAEAIRTVLFLELATIENAEAVAWAADRFEKGADWADMLHLVGSSSAHSFVTFDRRLPRQAGRGSPVTIEVVR